MKLNRDVIEKLFNVEIDKEDKKNILDILNIYPKNDREFCAGKDKTLTVKEFINGIIDAYMI